MIEIPTQLRKNCPICGGTFGYYFLPHGDQAQEECRVYKLFQTLKSKFWGIKKPRSVKQLNLYWACCAFVAENLSDHEGLLDKNDIDFDVKIRVAKTHPVLIKRFKVVDMITHVSYISIAFRNMRHLEACKYFDVSIPLLGKMVGVNDAEKFIDEVKKRMG